jgi:hypothetical protein
MMNGVPVKYTADDLKDRTKAFDIFRKSYRRNEAMEENRQVYKEACARGKQLGMEVNDIRNKMKEYTNKIEQIRKENALRGNVDENHEVILSPEVIELQRLVSQYKPMY